MLHHKHETAKYLFQQKRYEEAKQVLFEIINSNIDANKSIYLSKIGDIYNEYQDYENAEKYYKSSLEENPDNSQVLFKFT